MPAEPAGEGPAPASAGDPLALVELLLGVLDDGRRTATYKLALLLALLDCVAEGSGPGGRATDAVGTRRLARRVVELYWPQVRGYAAAGGRLRQSSQPRAITVDAVAALREAGERAGARTTAQAELRVPDAHRRCLDTVELNLVRMPLGKLQRPAGYLDSGRADYPRFLYDDAPFHERVPASALPLQVRLRPGVGDRLVSLSGLLRPVVELHWTRAVARLNNVAAEEEQLRHFLFGTDRSSLAAVRPALADAQQGRCFYCAGPLPATRVHVDHFLPWARMPTDVLSNLVATDGSCNLDKSDHYPDVGLLARWAQRPWTELSDLSTALGWPLHRESSAGMLRSVYGHLPVGTRLWRGRGSYALLTPTARASALQLLGG